MYTNGQRLQRGMSLVEVFVALLVLSVGLIALAKLQVDLVRGGSDARARTIALNLAEEKIEDLRTFATVDDPGAVSWSTSANPMDWTYIDDNTGGRLPPQTTFSSTLEVAGVRFLRSWDVTDRDFTNVASGITTRTKDVTVTVSWQSETGASQPGCPVANTRCVQTIANVVDIPPGNVALASEPVSDRPDGPEVSYAPGVAPEVISVPIDTGTGKRETTKPLPTVVGTSGSNIVRFDVVNYHTVGNNAFVDKREEFVTINCSCEFEAQSSGLARTPARTIFQNGTTRDVPGKMVLKKRGIYTQTGSNAQPLCAICCRDHHDYTDADGDYFYNPDVPSHPHYSRTATGSNPPSYTFTEVTSGAYEEACRLKRINGVFQVFEDWKLDTLTVLPGSFLTNVDTQAEYVNYVKDYVEYRVMGGSEPAKPAGRNTSVIDGATKQLFGRALYVEVPDGLSSFISQKLVDDPGARFEDFLDLVPFYDINLTKLADWSSMNQPVVRVTSTDVRTEAANQDTYSRGRAEAVPGASASSVDVRVVASARLGNTGVTSTAPIGPDEDQGHPRGASSEFPLTGPPANKQRYWPTAVDPTTEMPTEHMDDSIVVAYLPPGSPGISGDIFPSDNAVGDPHLDITSVYFEGTTNGTCILNRVGASVDYSCVVPSGWTGDIVFSPSSLTYCGDVVCSVVHTGGRVPYGGVTSGLLEQTVWVE